MKRRSTMLKRYFTLLVIAGCFTFQGCAELVGSSKPTKEMKQTALDRELYEPYEKGNTIKGYEEFIAKYPHNRFVAAARREIEDLQFAAVKKINTLEGYAEFLKKYPNNPNLSGAQTNIEKIEIANCKKENISTCYQGFISKYPTSMFLNEAREYLQELEMKQFAQELRENYGFDLLLYRLNLSRLKKDLILEGKEDLGDFTFFVSFITRKGKKYFQTHLTFYNDHTLAKISPEVIPEEIFNDILSGQLEYLNARFKGKHKIDGFGFETASFPLGAYQRQTLLECYFPLEEVDHFAKGRMDKEALIKKSIIIPYSASRPMVAQELSLPAKEIPAAASVKEGAPSGPTQKGVTPALVKGESVSPPDKKAGEPEAAPALMKWASEKDGLVKDRKFVRTAPPAFSFMCPEDWTAQRTGDQFVFHGKEPSGLPSMRVMVTKIVGAEVTYLKSFPAVTTEFLRKRGGSNTSVLYSRPTDVYEGFSAYEFEINYKPGEGEPLPRLTTYVNVIAKDGYAIILEGESSGDIDHLKMIYETINLKQKEK